MTSQKSGVIEFRSGSYFQDLDAERGTAIAHARRWPSRKEAEGFMDQHEWILMV